MTWPPGSLHGCFTCWTFPLCEDNTGSSMKFYSQQFTRGSTHDQTFNISSLWGQYSVGIKLCLFKVHQGLHAGFLILTLTCKYHCPCTYFLSVGHVRCCMLLTPCCSQAPPCPAFGFERWAIWKFQRAGCGGLGMRKSPLYTSQSSCLCLPDWLVRSDSN